MVKIRPCCVFLKNNRRRRFTTSPLIFFETFAGTDFSSFMLEADEIHVGWVK